MFEISKTFHFEAAHSLPYLPAGHKCRNVHGHSYVFEVVCRGVLDDRDFVLDYSEISAAVNPILLVLDHKNLNDLFLFNTTAEKLCEWIFFELKNTIPVYQIHLHETASTRVTFPI